jgi:pyridoxal phosphate enzyme (YggS family)
MIREAWEAGINCFGENYIQEAREKIPHLPAGISWHFIGHLQTNKARYAVRLFGLIHTVDSVDLALALNDRAAREARIQSVLIQVNPAWESTKSGISPEDLTVLAEKISGLDHLLLKGLMTMPPFFPDPEMARPYFRELKKTAGELNQRPFLKTPLTELSMGMTQDFEAAVEEGATLVRIGTAIFGARN